MDVQQLDVIVRVAGVTLLAVLAAMLVRSGGDRRMAAFFVPLALCLGGFLASNTPDPALRLTGFAGDVAHLLSGYAAVFLWWFCLACFDRAFRPTGPVLAAGITWLFIASADRGLLGAGIAGQGLSRLLVLMGFAMVGHLAWRLIRDRDGDLVERRRNARLLAVVLLVGQLLLDLAVDVIFGFDWRPRAFSTIQNMGLLAFTLWMLWPFLGARPDAHELARDADPDPAGDDPGGLIGRLRILIEVDRVHLDPELSFAAFVRRMSASERTVRELVNHRLGYDHFRAFLNAHRLAEAKRLLADPARADTKLITIAMDSGFASLASFNRAFREWEKRTPSDFRQQAHEAPPFEERSAVF